jgi:hypothetical protein
VRRSSAILAVVLIDDAIERSEHELVLVIEVPFALGLEEEANGEAELFSEQLASVLALRFQLVAELDRLPSGVMLGLGNRP